jgi:hypothetical protein
MRPLPLVLSTICWSAWTVIAFGYAAHVDLTFDRNSAEFKLGMGVLAVLFFLTCALLWFLWSYWQGQDWARTFVIVGLIIKFALYLHQAGHIHRLAHGFKGSLLAVRALDFIFSIYIFYWLMTKEARNYFKVKARTS